jgi:hypothetical protein
MVDSFSASATDTDAICSLVKGFEAWARQHAKSITEEMPEQEQLDKIRPQWLDGDSLRMIVETCGDDAKGICTGLYGYHLPWLFHAVAQKLDKLAEVNRVEILAKVGLLLELGLPTEAAAKVFLAGVRSRAAAVELSRFVTNPAASVSRVRTALLDSAIVKALSASISASTLEWLHLLSAENETKADQPAQCARFRLKAPSEVETLHSRQLSPGSSIVLCSTDARFKVEVGATEQLPFDKFVNDPRFIFAREGNVWVKQCRDPRVEH